MIDINTLYSLKPGEQATIVVVGLNESNKNVVSAAITCVDPKGKKSKEAYFQVISITGPAAASLS